MQTFDAGFIEVVSAVDVVLGVPVETVMEVMTASTVYVIVLCVPTLTSAHRHASAINLLVLVQLIRGC